MNTLNENRKNNVTEYPIEVEYQELVLKGRIIYSAKSFKVFLYEPVNGYDAGDWTGYDENDPLDDFHARGHLPTAVIVDPAKTVTMHSAESAIVGVSVDTEQNLLWWRQTLGLKIHPDELYDMAADMAIRINADVIAVEVTSLHEFITQPMKDHLATRGWKGEFIELHATGKKEDRIMSLVSYS